MQAPKLIRVGHRGADRLVPGNTIESFAEAVSIGVEVIELDVIWTLEEARAPLPRDRPPLMVAHDRGDLAGRDHPSLVEALDAFTRAPLDQVEIDVDVKLAGREEEIVAAVREQGLSDRVMFSGMELESLRALAQLAPEMRRGWTLPKVSGDWRRSTLAKPFLRAAMANLRARLPRVVASRAAELGVWSVWVFHPLVSPRLVESAHASGLAVFAWTVDDVERQRELVALGVDGLVSNDPRTFRESIGVAAA